MSLAPSTLWPWPWLRAPARKRRWELRRVLGGPERSRGVLEEGHQGRGVHTGAFCINPSPAGKCLFTWPNFVLMEIRHGAVMAVPAHDQRDFEFRAEVRFAHPVVIQPPGEELKADTLHHCGVRRRRRPGGLRPVQRHGQLPGQGGHRRLPGRERPGQSAVHFRLQGLAHFRQPYWRRASPSSTAGLRPAPVPESDLRWSCPLDVAISREGALPPGAAPSFYEVACPTCGARPAGVDTNGHLRGASWYFLRYAWRPTTPQASWTRPGELLAAVDQYIGASSTRCCTCCTPVFTKVLRTWDGSRSMTLSAPPHQGRS